MWFVFLSYGIVESDEFSAEIIILNSYKI